ncbi:hypothetical protein BVX94_03300 [bacterium B17]|nr:hypothetical protein BVX94_03300 [bacterium B17]
MVAGMKTKPPQIDKAMILLATMSGIILFGFFGSNILRSANSFETVVRIIMSVIAPIPLLVFIAFASSRRKRSSQLIEKVPVKKALVTFMVSILITILLSHIIRHNVQNMAALWHVPLVINSYVYAFNLYNYLTFRSVYASSILSAVSLGITMYVLFV